MSGTNRFRRRRDHRRLLEDPFFRFLGSGLEHLEERRLLSATPLEASGQPTPNWFQTVTPPTQDTFQLVRPIRDQSPNSSTDSNRYADYAHWVVQLNERALQEFTSPRSAIAAFPGQGTTVEVLRGLGLPGQLLVGAGCSTPVQLEADLARNPYIATYAPDVILEGDDAEQLFPGDWPASASQYNPWALHNTGLVHNTTADADIDAPEAWHLQTGDRKTVVAVIDSGINYEHPDLAPNIWINPGEIPTSLRSQLADTDADGLVTFVDLNHAQNASLVTDHNNNGIVDAGDLLEDERWADELDNDQNGFFDDLHGWDFTNHDHDPMDDQGHGTHVAGTIGAMGNNDVGVTGVTWSSSLMPLKFLGSDKTGRTSHAVLAINYATMMKTAEDINVRVLNNSWGTRDPVDNLFDAVSASRDAGILFVASAGNNTCFLPDICNIDAADTRPYFPASYDLDNLIVVAASDRNDKLSYTSQWGPTSVDLVAPGVSIYSTLAGPNDFYGTDSGTSMAVPHVSGAAALIWSQLPDATVEEVRNALLQGVDSLPGLEGRVATGGRLNAHGALTVDTYAPRVTTVTVADVAAGGNSPHQFTVSYRDNKAIAHASIDSLDILVTRGAGSEPLTVQVQQISAVADHPEIDVIYQVGAPGGTWDPADNGIYQLALAPEQVHDVTGFAAAAGDIGTFQVTLLGATEFTVNTTADTPDANPGDGYARDSEGHTSLRAAIQETNTLAGAHTIHLPEGDYRLTIPGPDEDAAATGDLDILDTLLITTQDAVTIDANNLDRAFDVGAGASLTLSSITLTGGHVTGQGGAIRNFDGHVSLNHVTIHANQATDGGALANLNGSTLLATDITISDNAATTGGALVSDSSTSSIANSTITDNTATLGGGLHNRVGGTTITNTIVAGNIAATSPDLDGSFSSAGHNLIGNRGTATGLVHGVNGDLVGGPSSPLAAQLSPLADHGGFLWTHIPGPDSPALDSGSNSPNRTTDQRLIPVPQDGDGDSNAMADIGAAERYHGEIRGRKYRDLNQNGISDLGEPGLAGWVVFLDSNGNRRLDGSESLYVTDSEGNYEFTNLDPGNYRVVEAQQEGWLQTGPGTVSTGAVTFTVTSTADTVDANLGDGLARDSDGTTTLRAAIMEANALGAAVEIMLPAGTYNLSIAGKDENSGTTGDLDIKSNVTIIGAGADSTIIDGNDLDRVLDIYGDVSVSGVTITGGKTTVSGGGVRNSGSLTLTEAVVSENLSPDGGGLFLETGSNTNITLSSVVSNTGNDGGGIFSKGSLTITNSTISGNQAVDLPSANGNSSNGGGILNWGPLLSIANSTITANSVGDNVGGLLHADESGTLTLGNTIVAGNLDGGVDTHNLWGDVTSLGNNLVGRSDNANGLVASDLYNLDPKLGLLADNGGPTPTHALLADSPAIDAGNNDGAPAADQRGIPRPLNATGDGNSTVDIGAYELGVDLENSVMAVDDNYVIEANTPLLLPRLVLDREDFTADPGWTIEGSGSNGNNFGYHGDTTRAGGDAGEIGGRFTRSSSDRILADTQLLSTLSFNDPFRASGKLDLTAWNHPDMGRGLGIGHFNRSGLAGVSISIGNFEGDQAIWYGRIRFNDGSEQDFGKTLLDTANHNRSWSYQWDPRGGDDGWGAFTLDLDGVIQVYELTEGQRRSGLTNLDAFGFHSLGHTEPDSNKFIDVFVDDLSYSGGYETSLLDNDTGLDTINHMYWSDSKQGIIQRANLDGSNVTPIITGLSQPHGFAVDSENGKLYWSDMATGKIQRSNTDGTNIEDVVTSNSNEVYGITLDVANSKIYWTNLDTNTVRRANLDGSGNELLVPSHPEIWCCFAAGITLDLPRNKLYWANSSKILMSNADGSDLHSIHATGIDNAGVQYVAVDSTGEKIYWTEKHHGGQWNNRIRRADLDGSNAEDIVTDVNADGGIAGLTLDLHAGKMYWLDGIRDEIFRATLDGADVESLAVVGPGPGNVHAAAPVGLALDMRHIFSPTITAAPEHGSLDIATNGTFTYTPDADFTGIDSFNYRLNNGASVTNAATVTIDVQQTTTSPPPVADGFWQVHLHPGKVATERNFGNHALAGSIAGTAYNDLDRDGYHDENEPPLASRTVYLDTNDNGQRDQDELTAITIANGSYAFTELEPLKDYVIRQVPVAEWTASQPSAEQSGRWDTYLLAGQDWNDANFGSFENTVTGDSSFSGTIQGHYFQDINGNRQEDPGEPVMANIPVFLDINKNGLLDDSSTIVEPNTTTDSQGNYLFENLPHASYLVATVIPSNMKQTTPVTSRLTVAEQATGSKPRAAATGDLDRDGLVDLAIAEWGGDRVSVFLADGIGGYLPSVSYGADSNPSAIIAGQFTDDNSDGTPDEADHLDMVVTNFSSSTISFLRNQGDGTFATQQRYNAGLTPRDVASADVNGDGQLDLVIANEYASTFSVLLNDGAGIFSSPTFYSVGNHPVSISVADLNNDSHPDVVTANLADNTISVLAGNSSGTFASPTTITVGRYPSATEITDINLDNKLDVVTANIGSHSVTILKGDGSGTFASPVDIPAGLGPATLLSGDIDLDGDIDLVVSQLGTSNIQLLENLGDGSFATAQSHGDGRFSDISYYLVAMDDLDNDGDPDLAVANHHSDSLSVLKNELIPERHVATLSSVAPDAVGLTFGLQEQLGIPTLAAISPVTFHEDAPQHELNLLEITAGPGESQPLRVTATSSNTDLVPHPSVSYTSPQTTGSISFQGVADGFGSSVITVTVEDAGPDNTFATTQDNLSVSQSFLLTITPVNDKPVSGSATFEPAQDITISVDAAQGLLAISSDVEDDNLTFTIVTSTAYGELTTWADGRFTYQPNQGFNRSDFFTYRLNDGQAEHNFSDLATIDFHIDTPRAWYNSLKPLDVNDDTLTTPLDVLWIINNLNANGSGTLVNARTKPLAAPFYDVNKDGVAAPLDALIVINYLNMAAGEGEGTSSRGYYETPLSTGPLNVAPVRSAASTTTATTPAAATELLPHDDAYRTAALSDQAADLLGDRTAARRWEAAVDQLLEEDLDSPWEDLLP